MSNQTTLSTIDTQLQEIVEHILNENAEDFTSTQTSVANMTNIVTSALAAKKSMLILHESKRSDMNKIVKNKRESQTISLSFFKYSRLQKRLQHLLTVRSVLSLADAQTSKHFAKFVAIRR